jgi:dynein heavy chain 2
LLLFVQCWNRHKKVSYVAYEDKINYFLFLISAYHNFSKAVKGIRRENLNEIKSFKTPPQAIVDVLSGVLMLQGIKDLSWNSMKGFLGKRGVIEDILNFDVKKVSQEIAKKVKNLLKKKGKSFEKSVISRVSAAAAPLASWVTANLDYMNILTKVKPLESELSEMTLGLDECKTMLTSCEMNMTEIDGRVSILKSNFAVKTREAERLKNQLQIATDRSEAAIHLIDQLCGKCLEQHEQGKLEVILLILIISSFHR